MRKSALPWLLVFSRLMAQTPASEANPFTSPEDVEHGARLFAVSCSRCHGPGGTGGRGPDLTQTHRARANDDRALFQIVHDGIAGTETPANRTMTDHETWQVIASRWRPSRAYRAARIGSTISGGAIFAFGLE